MTRSTMPNPLVNCYQAADDRWFWLLGVEADRHWPALVAAVSRPEWMADPRFVSAAARAAHAAELTALLDEIFVRLPRSGWASVFAREGVWWAAVQSVQEVVADPQVHASGAVVDGVVAGPCDFSGEVCRPSTATPALGEHTADVLAEVAGMAERESSRLGED